MLEYTRYYIRIEFEFPLDDYTLEKKLENELFRVGLSSNSFEVYYGCAACAPYIEFYTDSKIASKRIGGDIVTLLKKYNCNLLY